MSQPAKRKNTEPMPLAELIGDDGELRYDADTFHQKPKRQTESDSHAHKHRDEIVPARPLNATQVFLRRFALVLVGALGIVGLVLAWPYLPVMIVLGGAAYVLRQPLQWVLNVVSSIMLGLGMFALRLALGGVATFVVLMLTFAAGQIVPSPLALVAGLVLWVWVIGVMFGFVKIGRG